MNSQHPQTQEQVDDLTRIAETYFDSSGELTVAGVEYFRGRTKVARKQRRQAHIGVLKAFVPFLAVCGVLIYWLSEAWLGVVFVLMALAWGAFVAMKACEGIKKDFESALNRIEFEKSHITAWRLMSLNEREAMRRAYRREAKLETAAVVGALPFLAARAAFKIFGI